MKRGLKQKDLKAWVIKQPKKVVPKITVNQCGPILVELGDTITIEAHFTYYSDDEFTVHWQKIDDGGPRNIILDNDNYNGSSCDLRNLKLIISDSDHNDTGDYQIEIKSPTATFTSTQVRVTVYEDSSSLFSNEEVNYLRLYVLCLKIGTNAVRLLFDRYISTEQLSDHLKKYRTDLERGNCRLHIQRCTTEQLKTLFQANPGHVKSTKDFDLTLLYLLIRSTVQLLPPSIREWGRKPLPEHTTEADDLERIIQTRNRLVHQNGQQLTHADFNSIWHDLSTAIGRLSNGCFIQQMNELHQKTFRRNEIKEFVNEVKASLRQQKEDIKQIDNRVKDIEEVRYIPKNIRESQEQQMACWEDEDRQTFYFDTSVCKAGWDMVGSESVITFIGGPGCGKSATSRHLALKLKKERGYEIVPVCKPEQIIEYVNTEKKQVFLLDDVLGNLSIDMTLYNNIERHRDSFDTGLAKSSKIFFTCRKTVYNEAKRFKSYITANSVDFQSEENRLTENDKSKILERHCLNKHIGHEAITNISLTSTDLMFPLLCKIFSTNIKYRNHGENFFKQPIDCYLDEIDKLQAASKTQYTALILCLIKMDEMRVDTLPPQEIKADVYNHCGLNLGTSDREIVNALEELTETYITKLDNTYSFIHDSIYEVVAYHYGKQFPDQMIEYIPSNFIANKVKVCQQQRPKDDLCIILDTNMYPNLAKRLYKDIQSLALYDVFKNPALKHPKFLAEFIKLLESKPYSDVKDMFLSTHSHFYEQSLSVDDEDRTRRQQLLLNITNFEILDFPYEEWIREDDKFICDFRVISWVVYYAHPKILKYILDKSVKNNMSLADMFGTELYQSRLLTLGCLSNECSIVELLLKYVSHDCINQLCTYERPTTRTHIQRFCSPALAACQKGNIDIIKLLLRNGARFFENDLNGLIPLLSAINNGYFVVVKYIVTEQKGGISPQLMQCFLCQAARSGHVELVNLFVQLGGNINMNGITYPVIAASHQGHYNIVKLLVGLDADINCTDEDKDNPLLAASREGHIEIVKFLLENGAEANSCDTDDSSPLIEASRYGHKDIVAILAESGANVNLQDQYGNSPLILAARVGCLDIAKYLLEKEACVNVTNCEGYTPLINAVRFGLFELTTLLLKYGADVSVTTKDILSPLSSATQQGRYDIVNCLFEHSDRNHEFKDLTMSLKIALWSSGRVQILHRLLDENNKRENFSGNCHLFDMLIDIKKDKMSCECTFLRDRFKYAYLFQLSKYRTLLTFIKACSRDDFSRMLNIGLNPNSSVHECRTLFGECKDSERSLIELLMTNDIWVFDRKEKISNLLEHEVNMDVKCKTWKGDRTDELHGNYEYISVIEYARLQSSDNDQPLIWTPAQHSPLPYYFDIPIDDADILSEIVKHSRRKSFCDQSKRLFANNQRDQAIMRRYTL